MALTPLGDDNSFSRIHFQNATLALVANCLPWWAYISGFGASVVLVIPFWQKSVPHLNGWLLTSESARHGRWQLAPSVLRRRCSVACDARCPAFGWSARHPVRESI